MLVSQRSERPILPVRTRSLVESYSQVRGIVSSCTPAQTVKFQLPFGCMPKRSAGLLVYRMVDDGIEVLAVHPGGPFWAKKDAGAWSIPKGELELDSTEEDPYLCARREFEEELGQRPPEGEALDLGEVRQSGGKTVRAWALAARDDEIDPDEIESNMVDIEWPPRSGRPLQIPEVDRAAWMTADTAREKLNKSQVELIERLLELLGM
jgi:predicted NUDIX family NTP pyrophosphohydrolase